MQERKSTYYQELKLMRRDIESIIKRCGKIKRKRLVYEILKAYAVSNKAVDEYIDTIVDVGLVNEADGFLVWVKDEKS